MPLSEDEQRILQEMEQKLYEHDRAFVDRVRSRRTSGGGGRSVRSSVLVFVVGFAVVILSFRSSLLLATAGFLCMLGAALLFERRARHSRPAPGPDGGVPGPSRSRPGSGDAPGLAKKLRTRFWQQH